MTTLPSVPAFASATPTVLRGRRSLTLMVVASLLALSGCSWVSQGNQPVTASQAPTPHQALDPEARFPSQFTRDGTFQSHIEIDDIDFVYTLWPTKSTPRTHEWFARGRKHFSFSLTAYDLERRLRDPFATKRQVWLGRVTVTSRSTIPHHRSQQPYRLDAEASRITFDPEPVSNRLGMLITSPKGAFELRNQTIGPLRLGTVGVVLTFAASVHIEIAPGSGDYYSRTVRQRVPITIYPGSSRTRTSRIPLDSN